jgi:hypothetical protein
VLQRFKTTGSQESAANCSDFEGMVFGFWILNRIFRCSLCCVCHCDPGQPTRPSFVQVPVLALRLRASSVDVEVGVLLERSAIAAAAAAARAVGMRVSLPSLCSYSGGRQHDDSCGPEEYFDCGSEQLMPIILPDTWPSATAAAQWRKQGGLVLDIISTDFPFVLHVPPASSSPTKVDVIRKALASSPPAITYREELRRHVEMMLGQMKKCVVHVVWWCALLLCVVVCIAI